ncbi:Carbonic anhydrase family protein [Sulfidibacter corallicola]|uniref:carbonic anhydrase n=1 Tax=Sulfidibacter corallicola TaxID=2818388 RepID=A0A8A4TJQ9_SULCO|nr:carbonic anhydrase family protein [Sulfidibacter corallicola]QTD49434.1 carbonic anhydrase family protein [Sulfidibacter corallicola]
MNKGFYFLGRGPNTPPKRRTFFGRAPRVYGIPISDWEQVGSGNLQSPIDLGKKHKGAFGRISFRYGPVPLHPARLTDRSLEIPVASAHPPIGMFLMGDFFELDRLQFHTPSEHKIANKRFAMSAHLVHHRHQLTAVVGVLFQVDKFNPGFERILDSALGNPCDPTGTQPDPVDLTHFIPDKGSYYRYLGSLTTAPHTEGVIWTVFDTPLDIADFQYRRLLGSMKSNARPIQPTNDRTIKYFLRH